MRLYRRLDEIQRKRSTAIALSILVLLLCGWLFGTLITTSYGMDAQRRALRDALDGQNLAAGDVHAENLARTGHILVNGREYGSERLRERADQLFDDNGNLHNRDALVEHLLADARPSWTPQWMLEQPGTTWMLAIVTTAWLLAVIWMALVLPMVLVLLGTAVPVAIAWALGSPQAMLAFAGMGLLTFTYVLLTRVMILLYQRPIQVLAVAQTLIREASRSRISLVFIVLLLVLLPLLPLWLDPESPLRFRIQTFISRSMGLTFFLAACMTLFLSCATVAFEIRDRQIWQLVTKPMNRLSYLVGKWLGVMTVNLVLLAVSGVSTFTFIQYLRQQPVERGVVGQLDALAVRDEVLTARVGRIPDYQQLTGEQLRERVRQYIERSTDLSLEDEIPAWRRVQIAQQLQNEFLLGQRTVPPNGGYREYVFSGLGDARDLQSTLTLRYRFHILESDEHETFPSVFMFNDDPNLVLERNYVPTMSHVLPISTRHVRDDGTLKVALLNPFVPPPSKRGFGALNFELDDFELLYKVGNFEPNFLRAVMVNWTKLAFLAMLGIFCATYLSFSIACLLSFTVFVAGALGPYLAASLQDYVPPDASQMDWSNVGMVIQWTFQSVIRAIAGFLVFALSGFGEFSPTQSLVEGRLIPWSLVGKGIVKLGIIWSGLALIGGYLIIRSRQLAIYSGQG